MILTADQARRTVVFGQTNITSQQVLGCPSPVLEEFPHYLLLRDHQDDPYGDNPYTRYLRASWSCRGPKWKPTPEKLRAQVTRFLRLLRLTRQTQPEGGLVAIRTRTGQLALLDGNHRASIALFLNRDLEIEERSLDDFLTSRVTARLGDAFYGTGNRGMPYQSICDGDTVLVEGRRVDTVSRMGLIRAEDLENKSVLDLGCNLGGSSFEAAAKGASQTLGLEYNKKLVAAAVQLNTYFRYPSQFFPANLGLPVPDIGPATFDTVFCFSLIAHVKDKQELIRTLQTRTKTVLYFEGHSKQTLANFPFLSQPPFQEPELLGHTHDGSHTTTSTRPFFRVSVKGLPDL